MSQDRKPKTKNAIHMDFIDHFNSVYFFIVKFDRASPSRIFQHRREKKRIYRFVTTKQRIVSTIINVLFL